MPGIFTKWSFHKNLMCFFFRRHLIQNDIFIGIGRWTGTFDICIVSIGQNIFKFWFHEKNILLQSCTISRNFCFNLGTYLLRISSKYEYEFFKTHIRNLVSWPAVANNCPHWENFIHHIGPRCGWESSWANWNPKNKVIS